MFRLDGTIGFIRKYGCIIVAVAAQLAWSMPTKDEIKQVQPLVNELMAEHVNAYRARNKSAKDVGDAAFGFVKDAQGEATKYILLKGAIYYYSLARDFDQAADALEAMCKQINDVPPDEVNSIASRALARAGKSEAKRLRNIQRRASEQAKAMINVSAWKAELKKKPGDVTAMRGLASAYVHCGDWPRALKVFSKLGIQAAIYECNPEGAKDYNALKAADYWWGVQAKDPAPYRIHAAALYRKAKDEGLVTGLMKALVDKRIAEAESTGCSDTPKSTASSKVPAAQRIPDAKNIYCVIDLARGPKARRYPVTYLKAEPRGGWSDEYKTTKLVLRRIEPGTFIMGKDQKDESHRVTFDKPFYIGVFEVTQKQYELVTGEKSAVYPGDMRPVDNLSWEKLRGPAGKHDWPKVKTVAPDTFLGRIRERTGMEGLDLPSRAQWEYACRAGTTTDRYDGSKYNNGFAWDHSNFYALNRLGRCLNNQKERQSGQPNWLRNKPDGKGGYMSGTTTVGLYLPNSWGLYDMYGNVWELCVDPSESTGGGECTRAMCGGAWNDKPTVSVSWCCHFTPPSWAEMSGFRLTLWLE